MRKTLFNNYSNITISNENHHIPIEINMIKQEKHQIIKFIYLNFIILLEE